MSIIYSILHTETEAFNQSICDHCIYNGWVGKAIIFYHSVTHTDTRDGVVMMMRLGKLYNMAAAAMLGWDSISCWNGIEG